MFLFNKLRTWDLSTDFGSIMFEFHVLMNESTNRKSLKCQKCLLISQLIWLKCKILTPHVPTSLIVKSKVPLKFSIKKGEEVFLWLKIFSTHWKCLHHLDSDVRDKYYAQITIDSTMATPNKCFHLFFLNLKNRIFRVINK